MNSKHRPDPQWYARMIQDTLDDDFVIGPAFDAKAKEAAAPAVQPLTVAFGLLVKLSRRAKRLSVAVEVPALAASSSMPHAVARTGLRNRNSAMARLPAVVRGSASS